MEAQLLDFSSDDALAGFRLQTLEVYNWGTFHRNVWRLALQSRNALLTGDIGSGKSTLVDAVTTLLVPAHRVAYNKAAGADTRERSLRSYVMGYFKSERSDMGHVSKAVALRDHNSFSVILGVFQNEGYAQEVTLAQVFWIRENQGQPDRFYLVADRALSITEHFNDFGPDISTLKKRLKKMARVERFFPKVETLDLRRRELMGHRDDLKRSIAENGGDRLERIRSDIRRLDLEKEKRRNLADRYGALIRELSLTPAASRDDFDENAGTIQTRRETLSRTEAELQNRRTDAEVALRQLKVSHEELGEELEALSGRKSNIHRAQLRIRQDLCAHLDLHENMLPFAGELIQVREDERAWEGVAERLLHNFGLSLLVPENYYREVAAWVDRTRLRGRLVYYLVRQVARDEGATLHPDSLVRKLSVKPDSPLYDWAAAELARRFDYACCADMAQFHREPQAVTARGQIKSGGKRHEKDDRRDITDRSHYILGWTNEAKIRTLQKQRDELASKMRRLAEELSDIDTRQTALRKDLTALIQLGEFRDWSDLDWKSVGKDISRLKEEKKRLESASDILKTLEGQLEALEKEIEKTEADLREARDTLSKNEEKRAQTKNGIRECERLISDQPMVTEQLKTAFRSLEEMRRTLLEKHRLTVESCDGREKELRKIIQDRIDALDKRIRTLEDRIVKAMHGYRIDFPLETREVDDAIASAAEYEDMLVQLQTDNLPRFEHQFKELLNENTIREVANFQSQLLRERETIRERIDRINQSLSEIEYNPGRFIVLEAQPNPDVDIRDFQQQLRACTEGALTGSEEDHYSENKFLQVREVIQRFRGRDGLSEPDKRWTRKVTDVRNWFVFAASERWLEDRSEYEHYTDSGGKSGGQKEKLAYTVLAASLAYQFGLEWGAVRSRTFRFVAIDEAFGRGSDESTRYSLELFKKLNLQLLIVTPLQKIHIIEPYVSAVGLVYSQDGRVAQLRNMSVQEYREERKAQAL